MANEYMIRDYAEAQACFLPYVISDHSPAILVIPNCLEKKKRSFRFSNYITGKAAFIPLVKEEWNKNIMGFRMFVLAKKNEKSQKMSQKV